MHRNEENRPAAVVKGDYALFRKTKNSHLERSKNQRTQYAQHKFDALKTNPDVLCLIADGLFATYRRVVLTSVVAS